MSRIACPNCGFMNFAISAYCGRCERPLPREGAIPARGVVTSIGLASQRRAALADSGALDEDEQPAHSTTPRETHLGPPPPAPRSANAVPRGAALLSREPSGAAGSNGQAGVRYYDGPPPAAHAHVASTPTPTPTPAPELAPTLAPALAAAALEREQKSPTAIPTQRAAATLVDETTRLNEATLLDEPTEVERPLATFERTVQPTLVQPRVADLVPAPALPEDLATVAASPAPIEIGAKERKAALRRRGPNIADDRDDAEVPVTVPGSLRLGLARLVDCALVAAVGALALLGEASLIGATFDGPANRWLDQMADWLNLYRAMVIHSLVLTILFACGYSVVCAVRGGQTLGRMLTDTVLVQRSGAPSRNWLLALRAVVGLGSAALCGAGFFWSIVDPYHRTWHDLATGTVTVRRHVRLT